VEQLGLRASHGVGNVQDGPQLDDVGHHNAGPDWSDEHHGQRAPQQARSGKGEQQSRPSVSLSQGARDGVECEDGEESTRIVHAGARRNTRILHGSIQRSHGSAAAADYNSRASLSSDATTGRSSSCRNHYRCRRSSWRRKSSGDRATSVDIYGIGTRGAQFGRT
jgi:hypothetical protein